MGPLDLPGEVPQGGRSARVHCLSVRRCTRDAWLAGQGVCDERGLLMRLPRGLQALASCRAVHRRATKRHKTAQKAVEPGDKDVISLIREPRVLALAPVRAVIDPWMLQLLAHVVVLKPGEVDSVRWGVSIQQTGSF